MEKVLQSLISQHLQKNKNQNIEKKDADLTTTERLDIISNKSYSEDDFDRLMRIYHKKNISIDCNDNVFQDLELFVDNEFKYDHTVFSKIDFTKTIFGSIVKKKLLNYPIDNYQILKKRQSTIQSFIKHNQSELLINNLENIKSIESDLIWFWKHCNSPHMDVLTSYVYFDITNFMNINYKLNNNELLLNICNYYNIFIAPLFTIFSPIMTFISPLILMYVLKKRVGVKMSLFQMIKMAFKSLFNFQTLTGLIKSKLKAKSISLISVVVWIVFYIQNCNSAIKSAKNNLKIINIMQSKTSSLCKLVNYSQNIYSVLGDDFREYFDIDYNISQSIQNFTYLLKHNVFEQNNTLFNNKGKILKNFKIVNTIKNELIHLMKYIGIVDSCFSNKYLFDNKKYSFTNYSKSHKPYIQAIQFCHPYLDNAVRNDICLNGNNMLITGPNAAGKSTFIKSIMLNVIMSQTLGISSAESFTTSIFHSIETYLHIPDKNGISSLFETEMIKSKNYIDRISQYPDNKFSLIIMDEIFSSTNYIEGSSGAYGILKKLSTFDNNMTLITTHYSKLSKLEKTTNHKFKNYKFEITRNENNDILYNYKLQSGISNQNIALELLKKNEFDNNIINDALNFEKELLKAYKPKKTKKTKKIKKTKNQD
jgi:DNA mismatch repair protein MutS